MRKANGWERGTVDEMGFADCDAPEAWQAWADGIVERHPEATLLQLFRMTETGEFVAFESEAE